MLIKSVFKICIVSLIVILTILLILTYIGKTTALVDQRNIELYCRKNLERILIFSNSKETDSRTCTVDHVDWDIAVHIYYVHINDSVRLKVNRTAAFWRPWVLISPRIDEEPSVVFVSKQDGERWSRRFDGK